MSVSENLEKGQEYRTKAVRSALMNEIEILPNTPMKLIKFLSNAYGQTRKFHFTQNNSSQFVVAPYVLANWKLKV